MRKRPLERLIGIIRSDGQPRGAGNSLGLDQDDRRPLIAGRPAQRRVARCANPLSQPIHPPGPASAAVRPNGGCLPVTTHPDPVPAPPPPAPSATRKLGLIAAIALVMGNMIGSGVYLLPASLAPFGWNAVGGWVATIAAALVLALVFARLARALPHAGGAVGFVHEAFGHVQAVLVSWVYLVSNLTALVTRAVAAVSYLSSLVPGIGDRALVPAVLAVGLVWTMTALNLLGVGAAGALHTATTV